MDDLRRIGASSLLAIVFVAGCKTGSEEAATVTPPPVSVSGSVTLQWTPPMQNEDGSALLDLAGYNIYYGVESGNYPNHIPIDNPGIATYVVDDLAPGTYYFVATAENRAGIQSAYSNEAVKVVSN